MIKNNDKESLRSISAALKKHLPSDVANDIIIQLADNKNKEMDLLELFKRMLGYTNSTEEQKQKIATEIGIYIPKILSDKEERNDLYTVKEGLYPPSVGDSEREEYKVQNDPHDAFHRRLFKTPYISENERMTNDSTGSSIVRKHELGDMFAEPSLANQQVLNLVKIANIADENGMYKEADALTVLIPKIKTAQYEGFQQYCIQNTRAFENSVRQKMETKTPHDSWWETLEEYQESLMGNHSDFLSKYASTQTTSKSGNFDIEVSNLLLEEITEKMEHGQEPGVAVLATMEDIKSGRYAENNINKANHIIEAIKKNEKADKEIVEAGIWNNIKRQVGLGWPSPQELVKELKDIDPFLINIEQYIKSNTPMKPSYIVQQLAKHLIPLQRISYLFEKTLPELGLYQIRSPKSVPVESNGNISNRNIEDYINEIWEVIDISRIEGNVNKLDEKLDENGGKPPQETKQQSGQPQQGQQNNQSSQNQSSAQQQQGGVQTQGQNIQNGQPQAAPVITPAGQKFIAHLNQNSIPLPDRQAEAQKMIAALSAFPRAAGFMAEFINEHIK